MPEGKAGTDGQLYFSVPPLSPGSSSSGGFTSFELQFCLIRSMKLLRAHLASPSLTSCQESANDSRGECGAPLNKGFFCLRSWSLKSWMPGSLKPSDTSATYAMGLLMFSFLIVFEEADLFKQNNNNKTNWKCERANRGGFRHFSRMGSAYLKTFLWRCLAQPHGHWPGLRVRQARQFLVT